ncbi:MAG: tetratricopeptide repeat protein [Fimbriimonadales bacterium]|nr:tetratricopeptide repeat protein [Fimbriimonadales bacterium]MDW8052153.1 tetratricopeptide repeat protein [Armatimonadota bacterium]
MRYLLLAAGCALLIGALWGQPKPPEPIARKLTVLRQLAEFRLIQLADEYWHTGKHYKTMALMFVLIEYDPHDVENISSLAWLLDSYGETARAIQVYQRGIRLNPNRYDLYYDLGFAYFNKRQYQQALPYLEKATEFANAPALAWKTLAHCYERLGRYRDSLRAWEQAKAKDPNDPAVELNMQRVRRKLKEAQQNNP